jgi:hypothetical protein
MFRAAAGHFFAAMNKFLGNRDKLSINHADCTG